MNDERYLAMEAKQVRQQLEKLRQSRLDFLSCYLMTCLREAGVKLSLRLNDAIRDALEGADE